MKQLYIPDRKQWRNWLAKNHDKVKDGVWLVFYKKKTNKPSLEYEQAVEEALCFGWIDSIIKKIDDKKYRTIVVEPDLKDAGIFMQKGAVLIWLTDDKHHIPVKMKSKIAVGSITAKLRERK